MSIVVIGMKQVHLEVETPLSRPSSLSRRQGTTGVSSSCNDDAIQETRGCLPRICLLTIVSLEPLAWKKKREITAQLRKRTLIQR